MGVLPMRERYESKIEPSAEQHQAPDWIRYSPELIEERGGPTNSDSPISEVLL